MDHVQGPVQPALAAAAHAAWCTRRTSAPRSRSTPRRTTRSRSAISARSICSTTSRRTGSTRAKLQRTVDDRDADARQRHRHQFLHDPGGAPLQPAPPPGRPRPDGLPGCAVRACGIALASRRGRRLRRHAAWRRSPTTRSRPPSISPPSAAATQLRRLAVEPRASCRSIRSNCWRTPRGDASTSTVHDARLGRAARARHDHRHAQLEHDGDRADGDDLQHLRRRRSRSSRLPEPVRQIEHVGRLHGGERRSWCATSRRAGCGTR